MHPGQRRTLCRTQTDVPAQPEADAPAARQDGTQLTQLMSPPSQKPELGRIRCPRDLASQVSAHRIRLL